MFRPKARLGVYEVTALALCVALLTAIGCTAVSLPYPAHYPSLPAASHELCERVAGTYHNQADQEVSSSTLADTLFDADEVPDDVEVTLSFPRQGEMQATTIGPEGAVNSRVWMSQEDHFVCEADRVILRFDAVWEVAAPVGLWGRVSRTLHLYPLDDHLVVDIRDGGLVFLWFIIPSHLTDSAWYRYPRVH
jgi:hypothetical protein